MVYTINPVVHGGSYRRWLVDFLLHLIGGGFGGAAAATIVAVSLHAVISNGEIRTYVALAVAVLAIAADLDKGRHLPSPHRQVSQRTRELRDSKLTAFVYGFELGLGVVTRVRYAVTYAVFIIAGLALPLNRALLVGATYGIVRSAGVLPARTGRTMDQLDALLSRRGRLLGVWRASSLVVGVALLAATLPT